MLSIKSLANIITITRFVGAVLLLFTNPFSLLFWVLYGYCGVSDLADGLAARTMKQQSDLGAKLDSMADMAFFFALIVVVAPAVVIPEWIWICVVVIALIRVTAYGIGYKKYHRFSALHTYANKATGVFLFGIPALYEILGTTATGIILCVLAAFSTGEELLITVLSKDLDRNRKSIFIR
ncbi:MAG: CDP-alcohol phosphatidyltransferase family protein [Oscillospiraceae bacterium]